MTRLSALSTALDRAAARVAALPATSADAVAANARYARLQARMFRTLTTKG